MYNRGIKTHVLTCISNDPVTTRLTWAVTATYLTLYLTHLLGKNTEFFFSNLNLGNSPIPYLLIYEYVYIYIYPN